VIFGKSQVASKGKDHSTQSTPVTSLMQRDSITTQQPKELLYSIASGGGQHICGLHQEVRRAGDVTEE
jgi:hypothetical protein